jgi:hypothetical protein
MINNLRNSSSSSSISVLQSFQNHLNLDSWNCIFVAELWCHKHKHETNMVYNSISKPVVSIETRTTVATCTSSEESTCHVLMQLSICILTSHDPSRKTHHARNTMDNCDIYNIICPVLNFAYVVPSLWKYRVRASATYHLISEDLEKTGMICVHKLQKLTFNCMTQVVSIKHRSAEEEQSTIIWTGKH